MTLTLRSGATQPRRHSDRDCDDRWIGLERSASLLSRPRRNWGLRVSHAGGWGKRWTNSSCEKLFGPPDLPGAFYAGGAPRWKQRALHDATKDAFALSRMGVRLARLAVYDRCDCIELGMALAGDRHTNPAALVAFLEERLSPAQVA